MIWRRARRGGGPIGEAPRASGVLGDARQPGDPIGEAPRASAGPGDAPQSADPVDQAPQPGDGDPAARPAAGGSPRSLSAIELSEHRAALIDLVIYAYDRTASAGIRARLADGLAAIGVTVVRPDGEPFDPSRQEAGGVQPTQDAALHDRIAETERVGFADGERLIREPVVVVYRRR